MTTSTIEQTLQAGIPADLPCGRTFAIVSAAAPVDLRFMTVGHGSPQEVIGALEGFKLKQSAKYLRTVQVISNVDQTIKIINSDDDIELGRISGNINATIAQGTTTAETAFYLSAGSTAIFAGNAARRGARYYCPDSNSANVRIGSSAGAASSPNVIEPGGAFEDQISAAAAQSAYTTAAGWLYVQEVL